MEYDVWILQNEGMKYSGDFMFEIIEKLIVSMVYI